MRYFECFLRSLIDQSKLSIAISILSPITMPSIRTKLYNIVINVYLTYIGGIAMGEGIPIAIEGLNSWLVMYVHLID